MQEHKKEQGFTLIELLVAIVVVGILTAVAIVGIGGLTNKGSSSACSTSVDAARAAGAVYYANTGAYPVTTGTPDGFDLLTAATPPDLVLQGGVTAAGDVMNNGTNWTVTMSGGGGSTPNAFTACP